MNPPIARTVEVARGSDMIVRTARDAARLLEPLLASAEEKTVAVVYLDGAQTLLDVSVESESGADEAALPVRAILAKALALDAWAIVVAHSEPGGDPTPGEADLAATRELATAGRPLDVRLHDHLVFGGGEWRSFRALGLL